MKSIVNICSAILFAFTLFVTVEAATQECDSGSGVCVAFNIPVTTQTTSDNAEIQATVSAPGSLGWVGFGFGTQMTGSLMFVLWPNNGEVVISSRLASGHIQPTVYSGPGISVLSSTVTSSTFTAQLKLTNATSWSNSGSLNINSNSAGVIWAYGSSAPSNPSNSASNFQQHRSMGTFSIDMKAAQVQEAAATSASPSQSGASESSGVASPTLVAAPTITGVIIPSDSGTGLTYRDKVIIAHGVIMGICFVILFPLGAIIIRFLAAYLPVPTKLHYITQIFAFVSVLAAMGLGIYLSQGYQFTEFHQIFGIVIIGLILLQAMGGYYHHRRFVLDKPSYRRWFTHLHLWLGRLIIVLGLANAGCGLREAAVDWKYVVIWWAVCAALVVIYAVMSIAMTIQARKARLRRAGEPFGNAEGPGYSPARYKQAESYEMRNERERL